MRRKKVVQLALYLLLFFSLAGPIFATPTPPLVVVNHDTQECAEIFGGDECKLCYAPQGWEELDYLGRAQCPEDYTVIKIKERNCKPVRSQFCCIDASSGTGGDCESLIINDKAEQCAFVDNIAACNLSRQWQKRPESTDPNRWRCPWTYEWLSGFECPAEPEASTFSLVPLGICVAVAIVAVASILAWLLLKSRKVS